MTNLRDCLQAVDDVPPNQDLCARVQAKMESKRAHLDILRFIQACFVCIVAFMLFAVMLFVIIVDAYTMTDRPGEVVLSQAAAPDPSAHMSLIVFARAFPVISTLIVILATLTLIRAAKVAVRTFPKAQTSEKEQ